VSERALKLLKKVAEKGYISERELSEEEREIVKVLLQEGVLERCYTIAPEYRSDIVRLCKPRVVTVRHGESRLKNMFVKVSIPVLLGALPFYLFLKSILLGCLDVALFFLVVTGACTYGGILISRRLLERYRLIRVG